MKTYHSWRDKAEKLRYNFLPEKLRTTFYDNINTRPCYAALYLMGPNHVPEAITGYGYSFLALKPIIKFNSLFTAHDTMNFQVSGNYVNLEPCSIHYLGKILQNCGDKKFSNIINRVLNGTFLPGFSQQSFPIGNDLLDYIEAHIPNINFLDPKMVSHAHLDAKEIGNNLNPIKRLLESHGITVTHGYNSPYKRLRTEIFNKINKNDSQGLKELIEKFPALLMVENENSQDPLQFAASLGHHECITTLVPFLPNPNKLDKNGESSLHLAIKKGSEPSVAALLQLKDININIRIYRPGRIIDGATPVFMASHLYNAPITILKLLIKHGADTSLATTNGQTPLSVAAWRNLPYRINDIIATNNFNINSKIGGGHTALTNAIEECARNTISKIISIPGIKLEDRPALLRLLTKQSKRIMIDKNILYILMVFLQGTRQQGHFLSPFGKNNLLSVFGLIFPITTILNYLIDSDEILFQKCFNEKKPLVTTFINQYESGFFHWRSEESKKLSSDLANICNNPKLTPHRKNLKINASITSFFSKWPVNSNEYRESRSTQLLQNTNLIPQTIKVEEHQTKKGYFRLRS